MKNKYICIIPARAGSKRLKNKNVIKINRKKLFDYTLEAALKCKKISNVVITTNIKDLTDIKNKKIIFIKRPSVLCKDKCSTESAMIHAIKSLDILKGHNVVIILLHIFFQFYITFNIFIYNIKDLNRIIICIFI